MRDKFLCRVAINLFLADLSTKCSWWAIVVSGCPSSINIWCLHSKDHICDTIFMKLVQNVVLTISRPNSNMGHVGSKTRSPGQILGNSCLHSRGHICDRFWLNLVRIFLLTISRPSSNMGHVWSKTRSPGQILGKSCLHSRGFICNPILMKLRQNVCFDNI